MGEGTGRSGTETSCSSTFAPKWRLLKKRPTNRTASDSRCSIGACEAENLPTGEGKFHVTVRNRAAEARYRQNRGPYGIGLGPTDGFQETTGHVPADNKLPHSQRGNAEKHLARATY